MKILCSAILLSLVTVAAAAQIPAQTNEDSGITVIKKEWSFQIHNPALDESPFLAINERVEQEQDLRDVKIENRRRLAIGVRPVNPAARPQVERKDGDVSSRYVYKIKVKNNGAKTVRALILNYIFFDPDTKREIGGLQLASKKEISPGDTRTLVFQTAYPPTGTINAKDSDKKSQPHYLEQVIVEIVEFEDGSVWQLTPKNE